jgi:hypothetical protein
MCVRNARRVRGLEQKDLSSFGESKVMPFFSADPVVLTLVQMGNQGNVAIFGWCLVSGYESSRELWNRRLLNTIQFQRIPTAYRESAHNNLI